MRNVIMVLLSVLQVAANIGIVHLLLKFMNLKSRLAKTKSGL